METHEGKPVMSYDVVTMPNDQKPVSIDLSADAGVDEDKILCECPSDNQMEPINGKGGAKYRKHGSFCLEPQKFPDAINHPNEFESPILRPGETYRHHMLFKFFTNSCSHN